MVQIIKKSVSTYYEIGAVRFPTIYQKFKMLICSLWT